MISKLLLCIFFAISCSQVDVSSLPTTATSPTVSPPWISPGLGGKLGNAGAVITLGNKSMDALHMYAMDGIARAIENMTFDQLSLQSDGGYLTIKPPRIIEATLSKFGYQMRPVTRVWSRLFGGRLVADGQWEFRFGSSRKPSKGKYRAIIGDTELATTSQLGRTNDAKPTVQSIDCAANFTQLRVEIDGQTNLTLVNNCSFPVCVKARKFYENAICQVVRKFVQNMINAPMSTFPTRINLASDQQKLDYSLLNNEPKVSRFVVSAGLEGKIQWRGSSFVPFNPAPITLIDTMDTPYMVTFGMSDFTFNALFHQAHSQGYRFSATDLLSESSIKSQLSLNCSMDAPSTTQKPSRKTGRISPIKLQRSESTACLGQFIQSLTNDQFSSDDRGDLVFKTDKAPFVFILSERNGFFDGGIGNLEIYGPIKGGQRKLVGRIAVQLLRGEFTPKWGGKNITATLKLTRLVLTKASQRSMTGDWLSRFTQFSLPILTEMFNAFFASYAQFPLPLLKGFECKSSKLIISSRTIQVNCDFQGK